MAKASDDLLRPCRVEISLSGFPTPSSHDGYFVTASARWRGGSRRSSYRTHWLTSTRVMDENSSRGSSRCGETLGRRTSSLDGAFHKWKGRMLRRTWNEQTCPRGRASSRQCEGVFMHHMTATLLHKRKHELHRPNPSFRDDLAPLPDLQKSRSKRPRPRPSDSASKTRCCWAGSAPRLRRVFSPPNEAYRHESVGASRRRRKMHVKLEERPEWHGCLRCWAAYPLGRGALLKH